MHFCHYVFHEKSDYPEEIMRPYDECDEESYEFDYDEDNCYHISEMTADEADAMGLELDSCGEYYGYYNNPNGHYDWFEIGGRFSGMLTLLDGTEADSAPIRMIDIDKLLVPASHITPEDEWIDNGMRMLQPATDEQLAEFRAYVRSIDPDLMITVFDCYV